MYVPMCMRGAVRPSRCPSSSKQGARENLGHGVPADQDFPMQAEVCGGTHPGGDRFLGAPGETGRLLPRPGVSPAPPGRVIVDEVHNERKSGRCSCKL